MSQYADDLRAIVGIKDIETRLKAIENKAAIPGDRGVAYKNPDGTVSTSKSGGLPNGGYTNASNVANINKDKNMQGDPNNPATAGSNAFVSPENGAVDIKDLLDNKIGPQEPAPPGALYKDTLNRVTGMTDPVSGSGIMINEDGRFVPPSNPSWTTADDGSDPYWQLGYYWYAANPDNGYGATPNEAIEASLANIRATYPDPYPIGYGDAYSDGVLVPDGVDYLFTWYQGPGAGPNVPDVIRIACSGTGTDLCPVSNPGRKWPVVPYFQLALGLTTNPIGTLITSAYDTVAPLAYSSAPVNTVHFKFDSDTRFGARVPISGGGFAYGETNSSYVFTGDVHLFAADGTSLGVMPAAIYNSDYALP